MYVPIKTLRQAARILDLVADLDQPQLLAERVLPGLSEIVGGDLFTYCELGPGSNVVYRDYPAGTLDHASLASAFHVHGHEHPIVNYHLQSGNIDPVMISDFLSIRELHHLGLYADYLRPTAIEHQIAVKLPSATGQAVGISVCRSRKDFTETDRAVLAALAEPLNRAMQRAASRQRAYAALAATAASADGDACGLTDREQQVLHMVAAGGTNGAIASSLGVSPRTVAKHLENVYRKLGVTSRAAAVHRIGRPRASSEINQGPA